MNLEERMRLYEGSETLRKATLKLPVCCRLDGRGFHSFTRGLRRPYDEAFSRLMAEVTEMALWENGAAIGYTQSDEITFIWEGFATLEDMPFTGRFQKWVSTMASWVSVCFFSLVPKYLPQKTGELPTFDCRIWQVPDLAEAANVLVWREMDATRNSIQMAAQSEFSDKQLFKKNCSELQEMLFQKGINWNDYPSFFKKGTLLQKRKVSREFTPEEIEDLPPKHNARKNPGLVFERSEMVELDLPPLMQVDNKVGVLFHQEEPIKRVDKRME